MEFILIRNNYVKWDAIDLVFFNDETSSIHLLVNGNESEFYGLDEEEYVGVKEIILGKIQGNAWKKITNNMNKRR